MRLQIPATTANMGPGFDCIGMALSLYNYIDFEYLEDNGAFELSVTGEGADGVSLGQDNLIYQAYTRVFEYAHVPVRGIKMDFINNIPFSRGLGSSSAAIIGGIYLANHSLGELLSSEEMLNIALDFESHPDNIAPALLGGIVLSGLDDRHVFYRQLSVPDNLYCYAVIPDYPLATEKARAVLPQEVSMQDAVYNLSRMSLLVDALHRGDLQHLKLAMNDRLHQPYRKSLITGMDEIVSYAKKQGALNVTISGAGPTILVLSEGQKDFSGVLSILQNNGVTGRLLPLMPINQGAAMV